MNELGSGMGFTTSAPESFLCLIWGVAEPLLCLIRAFWLGGERQPEGRRYENRAPATNQNNNLALRHVRLQLSSISLVKVSLVLGWCSGQPKDLEYS